MCAPHDPTTGDPSRHGPDVHDRSHHGPDVHGPAGVGPAAGRRADAHRRPPDRGRTRCGPDRRNAAGRTDDRVSDPAVCGQPSCGPAPDHRCCRGRNHQCCRCGWDRHRDEDRRCRPDFRHLGFRLLGRLDRGRRHPGRLDRGRLHPNGQHRRPCCHLDSRRYRPARRRRHHWIARNRRIAHRQVAVPYCPSPPHPCCTPSCAQSRLAPPWPAGTLERCRGASQRVVLLCSTISSG